MESVSIKRGDFSTSELEKALNRKVLIGDIQSTWAEHARDRKTLIFAVGIAHSKAIIDEFILEGYSAAHIDCYTPEEQRLEVLDSFKCGDIQILSNVNILTTGFDDPGVGCAILARPTLSESLHIQQIGRILRPAPGKENAIILDHSGNTLRFGLPHMFKIPDLDSNDFVPVRKKRKIKKCVTCSECDSVIEPGEIACPNCGVERKVRNNEVVNTFDRLVSADELCQEDHVSNVEKQSFYQEVLWHCDAHNHKPGRAFWLYKDRYGENPEYFWKNLDPIPPTEKTLRFIKYRNIKFAKSGKSIGI